MPTPSVPPSAPASLAWDGFLSHAHAGQGPLVETCQRILERIATPWYRRRSLRLFRARGAMPYEARLWPGLERALVSSKHFVLFASPEAVQSPWVNDEVRWWISHRGIDGLIIVLAAGDIVWDQARNTFDAGASTAIVGDWFDGVFPSGPWVVDLRPYVHAAGRPGWLRSNRGLRQALLQVAARLHERPLDEMIDADGQQQRRIRLGLAAVAAGVAAASLFGWTQLRVAEMQTASARQAETGRLRALALEVAAGGIGPEALALMSEAAERAASSADSAANTEPDRVLAWWSQRLAAAGDQVARLPIGQIFEWQSQAYLRGPAGLEPLPAAEPVALGAYSPRSGMAYLIDREGSVAAYPPAAAGGARTRRVLGTVDDLAFDSEATLFESAQGSLLAVASRVSATSYGAATPTVRFFAIRDAADAEDSAGWDLDGNACAAVRHAVLQRPAASDRAASATIVAPVRPDPNTRPADCNELQLALAAVGQHADLLVQPRRAVPGTTDSSNLGLPQLRFPSLRPEASLWQSVAPRTDAQLAARVRSAKLADEAQGEAVRSRSARAALAAQLAAKSPPPDAEGPQGYAIDRIVAALDSDQWVRYWRRGPLELVLTVGTEGSKFSGVYTCLLRDGARQHCTAVRTLPPPGPRIVVSPDLRYMAVSSLSIAGAGEPSFQLVDLGSGRSVDWETRPRGSASDFAFDTSRGHVAVRIGNVAHVLDLTSGQVQARVPLQPQPPLRAPGGLADEAAVSYLYAWRLGPSMCFAMAGDLLLECTADGSLRASSVARGTLSWARRLGAATDAAAAALVLDASRTMALVRWNDTVRVVDLHGGVPLSDDHRLDRSLPSAPLPARRAASEPPALDEPLTAAWMTIDPAQGILVDLAGTVFRRPLPDARPGGPAAIACLTGLQTGALRQPVDLAACGNVRLRSSP